MPTPEQIARQKIDELLHAAGWVVQDYKHINLGAGQGVAVRKFQTMSGPADNSERLRQSTLKQAFEGKLVPQDPIDEPASVMLDRIRDGRDQTRNNKKTPGSTKQKQLNLFSEAKDIRNEG